MAITKVHHVGILVGDLEVGRHVYCDGFGLAVDEHRTPWPDGRPGDFDGVRSIEIPIGEMHLEISKPTDTASPAARFVAERGAGMYYISLASDDIVADVRGMQQRGAKIEGRWSGRGPVFLDPATCLGLRVQVTPDEHYYAHPYYKGDGTFTGMAHVGLAARSPEEIRKFLTGTLGLREDHSQDRGLQPPAAREPGRAAGDPVHLLEFPVGGTVLEISIPTTDDSGTARLVAQRAKLGAVFHHICPFAPDVHRAVDRGKAAGLQQIGSIPPREETTRATAWFHPRTCAGTLMEIWNRTPGAEHVAHSHGVHPGP